jgi:hypothetical protein
MATIKEYISNLELGELNQYKNMTIISVNGLSFPKLEFLTLSEAINGNFIKITEIDESGSVPTLKIFNNATSPVLLLDGEELMGAKQNRVLNTSILVPENFETEIPVSCTEQGRWSYTSNDFKESDHLASFSLRTHKSESVLNSLLKNESYRSNQSEVWEDVVNLCEKSLVKSDTMAMNDVYESKRTELKDYINNFNTNSDQIGVLIFINNEIAGMELLSTNSVYKKYHKKIIESYGLDALTKIKNFENTKDNHNDEKEFFKKAKEFINEIKTIKAIEKPSIGYGYDCRFVNNNIVGSLLKYEDAIVHTVFFKKAEIKEEEGHEINIISSSRRSRLHDIL